MTKIYTAGEHVRIIKADPGYNDVLGEKQVGLVGTVSQRGIDGGAYLKFPHTGDNEFFYTDAEIEPVSGTPTPEPEKEYLFREGDTVCYTGNNQSWKGSEFTVDSDVEKSLYHSTVRLTATKVPVTLTVQGYKVGSNVGLSSDTIEKFTPEPKVPTFKVGDRVEFIEDYSYHAKAGDVGTVTSVDPSTETFHEIEGDLVSVELDRGKNSGAAFARRLKLSDKPKPYEPKFKKDDWVQVHGRGDSYDGRKALVTGGPDKAGFYTTLLEDKDYAHFQERQLKATEKPVVHKFKVGDWVKVVNYVGTLEGKVGQITDLPNKHTSCYKVEADGRKNLVFIETELEATEEPHWTVTKPIGATGQVLDNNGEADRVILKTGEDEWRHLYQESGGKVYVTAKRNNTLTKTLAPNVEWVKAE